MSTGCVVVCASSAPDHRRWSKSVKEPDGPWNSLEIYVAISTGACFIDEETSIESIKMLQIVAKKVFPPPLSETKFICPI